MLLVRTDQPATQGANLSVRGGSGLQAAARAFLRTADGLKQFFGIFSVAGSPAVGVATFRNSATPILIKTRAASAIVNNPVGDIAYAWSVVDGSGFTIDDPTASSTTFSATLAAGDTVDGHAKCSVTDSGGHSGETDPISVSIGNLYGGLA